MALMATTLRLEAAEGSGIEEYRIWEGTVEVRRLQRNDEDQPEDNWQRLTHAELAAHVKDDTVVAHWLRQRLGWRRLLIACTDPQTLQEFGIPDNTLDRYAA